MIKHFKRELKESEYKKYQFKSFILFAVGIIVFTLIAGFLFRQSPAQRPTGRTDIACDFPEINIPFMHEMIEYAEYYDAVVPYTEVDKKEPLFSVYRRSLLGKIKGILDEGKNKISFLFECCRVKYLHMEDASWCKNINTPEDYQNFLDSFYY